MKKAQGSVFNIIVAAAIAIIILVVIIAIVTGKLGRAGDTIDDATKGVTCNNALAVNYGYNKGECRPSCQRGEKQVYDVTDCQEKTDGKRSCCLKKTEPASTPN